MSFLTGVSNVEISIVHVTVSKESKQFKNDYICSNLNTCDNVQNFCITSHILKRVIMYEINNIGVRFWQVSYWNYVLHIVIQNFIVHVSSLAHGELEKVLLNMCLYWPMFYCTFRIVNMSIYCRTVQTLLFTCPDWHVLRGKKILYTFPCWIVRYWISFESTRVQVDRAVLYNFSRVHIHMCGTVQFFIQYMSTLRRVVLYKFFTRVRVDIFRTVHNFFGSSRPGTMHWFFLCTAALFRFTVHIN